GGGTNTGGSGSRYRSQGFAHGTSFVSRPGIVRVHYGEGILDAFENRDYQRNKYSGSGGDTNIVVNFNGDMGDRSDAQVKQLGRDVGHEMFNEYMRQMAIQGLSGLNGGKQA